MVPDTLHDFFIASTGASAALIGLLFVAVSVAPERVFGGAASGKRTYRATSAFFVLSNGLFISLGSLLPQLNLGSVLLLVGAVGLSNTFLLLLSLHPQWSRELGRSLVLATGSLALYLGEIWNGVELLRRPNNVGVVDFVTYLVLAGYAIGLVRSWELVAGRDANLLATVFTGGGSGQTGEAQPPAGSRESVAADGVSVAESD